jgi:MoxR-like ATPase
MMLFRAAQALALSEGRNYCLPDDFKRLVLPVLAHRCIVSSRFVSTLKKSDQAETILKEIVEATPVPL